MVLSCGASPSPPDSAKVPPVEDSAGPISTDDHNEDTTPASFDSGSESAFQLLSAGEYFAMRVENNNAAMSLWKVDNNGNVETTDEISWEQYLDGTATLARNPLSISASSVNIRCLESTYEGCTRALVSPKNKDDRWVIFIDPLLRSPAGPWVSPRLLDLDKDDQLDVIFIAQGVDGCDRGPCPLFWVDAVLSSVTLSQDISQGVLITTADIKDATSGAGAFELVEEGGNLLAKMKPPTGRGKARSWTISLSSDRLVVKKLTPR